MKVIGIDFTSRPKRTKPMIAVYCTFENSILHVENLVGWGDFIDFEAAFRKAGPWIAGIDFPFGQSRTFIENIGWPRDWAGYVGYVKTLGRCGFRDALEAYRLNRPLGDKEHRRATDCAASAISPQKLYGVPVGLMFFEGAWRLLDSDVTIPEIKNGDPQRIVVEAYPALIARRLIGRIPYKNDSRKNQTADQFRARSRMMDLILNGALEADYGFRVQAPSGLADDPTGDKLDALFCAIQAAWAWNMRERKYGAPPAVDRLEGWIADPGLL